MRYLLAATAFFASVATTAGATSLTPPYMDARSDAEALIRSHYNALARREFSRAWSYYGDEKPAAISTVSRCNGRAFRSGRCISSRIRWPLLPGLWSLAGVL